MSMVTKLSLGATKTALREAWRYSSNAVFQRGFSARGRPEQSSGPNKWTAKHEQLLEFLENHEYIHDITGVHEDPAREFQNGLLSDKVKNDMYAMNLKDPERWTPEALAKQYLIREERATAILVLKRREKAKEARGEQLYRHNTEAFERHFGTYEKGTGEKYYRKVQTYPRYRVLPEGVMPKEFDPEEEERLRVAEDKALIADFNYRLTRNLQQLEAHEAGKKYWSRSRTSPPKPKGGYNLLIKPIGEEAAEPYVALPDGTQRKLNTEEQRFQESMSYKPYKREEKPFY